MKKLIILFLFIGQILNAQTFEKPVYFKDKVNAYKYISVTDSLKAGYLVLPSKSSYPLTARVNTIINYNGSLEYYNGSTWVSLMGYTLPDASTTVKGGVKIGIYVSMTGDSIGVDTTSLKTWLLSQTVGSANKLQGTWDTTTIKQRLHNAATVGFGLNAPSIQYFVVDTFEISTKNYADSIADKVTTKADTSLVNDTAYAIRQTVNTKLSSVSNDATLTGVGTATNVLKVDTNLIATKRFVRDSIEFALTGKQDSIGTWDASGNLFPSTDVHKGDWWTITVKGFVGGTDSVFVDDLIIAKIDAPGQTSTNWIINSAASVGVTVTGQKFNSSTKGVLYYNGLTPLEGTIHGGSAAPVGTTATMNVNGNLYASGILTQKTTPNYEGGILGVEKLTSSGWTTTNWTGDYVTGFKHTTGNTTALTNTLAAVSGTSYQISFTVTEATSGTFTITFGGQTSTAYSVTSAWGPKATTTGALTITPSSTFDGKIIISIKVISPYPATYILLDNTGAISYEQRNSQASLGNLNQGINAGMSITTGSNNINQGTNAGQSLTTGIYNINQGANAGQSLTTGIYNINQGANAGQYLTTGSNNINQGYSAGRYITTGYNNINQGTYAGTSITTGIYNINQGTYAGTSITTGSYNVNQGTEAGKSITTGSSNLNQGNNAGKSITTGSSNVNHGSEAGRSITTGSNNLNQGANAGHYLITGSRNINQGYDAGRYIADGVTTRTTGNNGVLIGYAVRASANGTDNEIAIGANAIAVGSNTFMLGNSEITGVYNYGSRYGILGTSNYYNATLGTNATNDKRTSATSTGFNWYNYTAGDWARIGYLSNTGRLTITGGLKLPQDSVPVVGNDTVALKSQLYTEKTYSELSTLISSNGLVKGNTYKITDRGDRGIFVKAISVNQLAIDATRIMLCPADYAAETDAYSNVWKGVWNSTKSVSINDLVIWGGKVWKNKTGAIGSSVDDGSLDATNWTEITKTGFANHEYIEMIFSCNYDFINDNITKQWDNNGNIITVEQENINYTDWNFASSGYEFYNNVCSGIYNNSNSSDISNNSNRGEISNNSNSGGISYNSNLGGICNNSNSGGISYNSNRGEISNNSNSGGISYNSNLGKIYNNSNSLSNIENNYSDVTAITSDITSYVPTLTTTTLTAPVIISKYDTLSSTDTVITYNAAVNPFRTDTIGENHTYHINGAVNGSEGDLYVYVSGGTPTITLPSGTLKGTSLTSMATGYYHICWRKVWSTMTYSVGFYPSYTGY